MKNVEKFVTLDCGFVGNKPNELEEMNSMKIIPLRQQENGRKMIEFIERKNSIRRKMLTGEDLGTATLDAIRSYGCNCTLENGKVKFIKNTKDEHFSKLCLDLVLDAKEEVKAVLSKEQGFEIQKMKDGTEKSHDFCDVT